VAARGRRGAGVADPLGLALSQYPYIVPPDLSIASTAAPAATLRLMLGVLAVGTVVLLPRCIYLFRVFKGSRPSSVIRHP